MTRHYQTKYSLYSILGTIKRAKNISNLANVVDFMMSKKQTGQKLFSFKFMSRLLSLSKFEKHMKANRNDRLRDYFKHCFNSWSRLTKNHKMKLDFRVKTFNSIKQQHKKNVLRFALKFLQDHSRENIKSFQKLSNLASSSIEYRFQDLKLTMVSLNTKVQKLQKASELILKAIKKNTFTILDERYKLARSNDIHLQNIALRFRNKQLLEKCFAGLNTHIVIRQKLFRQFLVLEKKSVIRMLTK